jgi:hypothetical protein
MKRRGLLAAAVLCALALAAGCSNSAARSSTAAAAPSPRPVSGDVERAYLAYWDAWRKANATSNPREPSLARYAASPQLDILRANLTAARQRHQVTKGTVGHRLEGMESAGGTSRVVDCIDLDRWLYYDATSGKLVHQLVDKPSQLAVFTLRQDNGTWRVTGSRVVGEC